MLQEFIQGFLFLIGYFLVCAVSALALRRITVVPREIFRKILHMILLGSIFVLTYGFRTWWLAVIAILIFTGLVYPALAMAERIPGYSNLLIERKTGEIKSSLVVVFGMFAGVISVCWGFFGEKYLVIASVLAWGLGDAAAALIGKRYGKNPIQGRRLDGNKTLEGSLAMFVFALLAVMAVLHYNDPGSWFKNAVIAVVTAAVTAITELYSKNGMDTLTCPLAAAVSIILLLQAWGGMTF